MALGLAGNGGTLKIVAAEVAFLNSWKISVSGSELDTTKFGDTDKRRSVGLKSGSGSASGTFASGDTTGQDALWTAYQARTAITLNLYVDATNKITTLAIVTKLNMSDDVNGVATLSFDFESDGAVTISTF